MEVIESGPGQSNHINHRQASCASCIPQRSRVCRIDVLSMGQGALTVTPSGEQSGDRVTYHSHIKSAQHQTLCFMTSVGLFPGQ